jgi:NitT/TauT family transport system substrate-binding protein
MNSLIKTSITLAAIFTLSSGFLHAQTTPVVVGIGGLAGNLIHPFVSKDAGLFQKYGVDARLVLFQGGSLLTQAQMSGDVKISVAAGTATIASRSQGADSIIVSSYMNTLDYSLVAAKGITQWQQLKGKRIAISRFGSSTDTAVRLVLEKLGMNPTKDVVIVQIGSQPTRFQALIAGSVDATIIAPPFDVTAKRQGYPILLSMFEQGIPYPHGVIETTDRLVQENPQLVKNFLKGFIAGIHYGFTNKEGTKRVMSKYLNMTDPEILDATYQTYLQTTDRKTWPDLAGMRLAVEEVAKRVPSVKGKGAEEFINTRFLDELQKEGFFEELNR